MKAKELQVGLRVNGGECLGAGLIVEILAPTSAGLAMVLWDRLPPREYNFCQNPSLVLGGMIEPAEETGE